MEPVDFEPISEDTKVLLRERQAELNRVLEALDNLSKTRDWKVLNDLIFKKSLDNIERQIKGEALRPLIDEKKLYRLQGEWGWAKHFTDIPTFVKGIKLELEAIKKKLQ